jgi:UPF0716 protein FxsA
MFPILLLLLLVLPFVEIYLLVSIGMRIGVGPTILLVIAAGVLGVALAGSEGLRAWRRIGDALAEGVMPGKEVVDALLVLIGGVLLVVPGVVSDVGGLILLLPPTRALVRAAVGRYFRSRIRVVHGGFPDRPERPDELIEVDFEEVDPREKGMQNAE